MLDNPARVRATATVLVYATLAACSTSQDTKGVRRPGTSGTAIPYYVHCDNCLVGPSLNGRPFFLCLIMASGGSTVKSRIRLRFESE